MDSSFFNVGRLIFSSGKLQASFTDRSFSESSLAAFRETSSLMIVRSSAKNSGDGIFVISTQPGAVDIIICFENKVVQTQVRVRFALVSWRFLVTTLAAYIGPLHPLCAQQESSVLLS